MTLNPRGWLKPGTIAIGVAALALGGAVGLSLSRRAELPATEATPAASIASGDASQPIAALEREASANPADGAKWQALGEAYFANNRYEDAARAYTQATQAAPGKAPLWSALGEARVMASKADPMPAQAVSAFRHAVAIDPRDPRARYFLAVQKDLAGDHAGAIGDWLRLLADTPQGAPWESDLRRTIAQVGKINHIAVEGRIAAVHQPQPQMQPDAGQGLPGPSPQELQAAAAIPPSQQHLMAEAMVAKLDARLQSEPHDIAGWVMLMRSRTTLGQSDKAAQALARAIAANPGEAESLRQQARMLGVKGS